MKKNVDGINGPVEVSDPLGSVTATIGDAANQAWGAVQAWKGREAPSDIQYEVQRQIAQQIKGATARGKKPVLGSFTEAERIRETTRPPRQQG